METASVPDLSKHCEGRHTSSGAVGLVATSQCGVSKRSASRCGTGRSMEACKCTQWSSRPVASLSHIVASQSVAPRSVAQEETWKRARARGTHAAHMSVRPTPAHVVDVNLWVEAQPAFERPAAVVMLHPERVEDLDLAVVQLPGGHGQVWTGVGKCGKAWEGVGRHGHLSAGVGRSGKVRAGVLIVVGAPTDSLRQPGFVQRPSPRLSNPVASPTPPMMHAWTRNTTRYARAHINVVRRRLAGGSPHSTQGCPAAGQAA
eukprot:144111-Chlamydomonas_euryale.AAC.2